MTLLNIYFYTFLLASHIFMVSVLCPSSLPLSLSSARSLFYLTRHYVFTTLFFVPLTVLTKRKRQTKRRVQTTRQAMRVAARQGVWQGSKMNCVAGGWGWRGFWHVGKHFSWRHFIKMGNESIPQAAREQRAESGGCSVLEQGHALNQSILSGAKIKKKRTKKKQTCSHRAKE